MSNIFVHKYKGLNLDPKHLCKMLVWAACACNPVLGRWRQRFPAGFLDSLSNQISELHVHQETVSKQGGEQLTTLMETSSLFMHIYTFHVQQHEHTYIHTVIECALQVKQLTS